MVSINFVMGRIGPDGCTAYSKSGLMGHGETLVEAMADLRMAEELAAKKQAQPNSTKAEGR